MGWDSIPQTSLFETQQCIWARCAADAPLPTWRADCIVGDRTSKKFLYSIAKQGERNLAPSSLSLSHPPSQKILALAHSDDDRCSPVADVGDGSAEWWSSAGARMALSVWSVVLRIASVLDERSAAAYSALRHDTVPSLGMLLLQSSEAIVSISLPRAISPRTARHRQTGMESVINLGRLNPVGLFGPLSSPSSPFSFFSGILACPRLLHERADI